MKNKKIMVSSIFFFLLLIGNVFASVGSPSGLVEMYAGTGSATGAYPFDTGYTRNFFEHDGYLYSMANYYDGATGTRFVSSDDNGTSWNDAFFSWGGIHLNGKETQFLDMAYDSENNLWHTVAYEGKASSQISTDLSYTIEEPSGGLFAFDYQYKLLDNDINTYDYNVAITLLDSKPVVVGYRDNKVAPYYNIDMFFANTSIPESLAFWTKVSYDDSSFFGGTYILEWDIHAINSTHVLLLRIKPEGFRIYGQYVSVSGFEEPFEIISEDTQHFVDGNGNDRSVFDSISENNFNSTAYAEEIAIAYVTEDNILKFAFFNTTTDTLSTPEIIANQTDVSYYEMGFISIGKDLDSYFVGWNGFRTTYDFTEFWVSERNPNTEIWTDTFVLNHTDASAYRLQGSSISKITLGTGYFACKQSNDNSEFFFSLPAEGEELAEAPEPVEPLTLDVDNEMIFIVVGIIAFMVIGFMLLTTKKGIKF